MRVRYLILCPASCQLGHAHRTYVGRLRRGNCTEGGIYSSPKDRRLLVMHVDLVVRWKMVMLLLQMVLRVVVVVIKTIDSHRIALQINVRVAIVHLPQPRVTEDLGRCRSFLRHNVQHMTHQLLNFRRCGSPILQDNKETYISYSQPAILFRSLTPESKSTCPEPILERICSGVSFSVLANGVLPSSMIYKSTPKDQMSQARS